MKTKFLYVFAAIFLVGFTVKAQSGMKIGYTNVDYILSLLPEAKEIEAELSAYTKQLESQLQSKAEEYQTKAMDLQQKMQSGDIIPAVAQDKQDELRNLEASIQKFQRDADASLQNKRVTLLQPAYDKIQKAINEVSEENEYTHVFSSDAGMMPVLLYARDEDNITNLILTKLGVEIPEEPAEGQ
ncbi:OmpH family outer membrane protein [Bacteroidota bacterium]